MAGFSRAALIHRVDTFFCLVGTTAPIARASAAASNLSQMASATAPTRSVHPGYLELSDIGLMLLTLSAYYSESEV